MSKHSHHKLFNKDLIPQKPKGSVLGIYRRLLFGYAFKHWGYLAIGVFFALLEGGVLMGLCQMFGMVGSGFEGDQAKPVVVEAGVPTENGDRIAVEDVKSGAEDIRAGLQTTTQAIEHVNKKQEKIDKQNAKIVKFISAANDIFAKVGIPQVDCGDGSRLTRGMLILLLVGLVLSFVLQALAILGNRYCLKVVGARVVTDMRMDLYSHLLDQSQAFYSRTDVGVGALISRCTNDIHAVEAIISVSFPDLIVGPIQVLAAGFVLVNAYISNGLTWKFALILVLMGVLIWPVYYLCRLLKRFEHRVLDGVAEVTNRMQETYSGIKVVRAFRQEEREKEAFRHVNEKYFRALRRAIQADVAVHPILTVVAMSMVGVFILMCYEAALPLGVLGGMAYAGQSMWKPIKDLIKLNSSLQKGGAAAERFFEVMDLDTRLPEAENPRHITSFDNEIKFKNVSFSYTPQKAILQHVSLSLKKGEMVALVGQTGSGKSTIANLLARFYDPTKGEVTIDGVNLKEFDVTDFRNLVGIVSQDTFLFNTTIEENIRYGRPDATHEEVVAAARQANALEFIEKEPLGLNRIVGERGDNLSGGQKQRIAIARAILRNPPILILDEATSALDTVTERLVQEALNNVMKDRTVLAIAHRLSTVRAASCILVLDGGRVIERGTDAELLAQGGIYKRLVQLQFNENNNAPEKPKSKKKSDSEAKA